MEVLGQRQVIGGTQGSVAEVGKVEAGHACRSTRHVQLAGTDGYVHRPR